MGVMWSQRAGLVGKDQAPSPLRMQIRGTRRDGEIVTLRSEKCSIGAAPGCTLRLRAAGVRSIECLILRGSNGAAVRACTRGVRLNGRAIGDAALAAGDRLKIGPIEFEILSSSLDESGRDESSIMPAGTETTSRRD